MPSTEQTTLTHHRLRSVQRPPDRQALSNRKHRETVQRYEDRQKQQNVVRGWSSFITAKMFKDRTGSYHPFVLNNLIEQESVTQSDKTCQRRRMLTTVCETATLALNPTFSKSHPTRHRPTDSCGIVVLPATTTNGIHLHGFIRVPKLHPGAVDVVAAALMVAFQTKNIWISPQTELQQDGASLDYLSKTWKQEDRHWDQLEFVPSHVFTRLQEKPYDT